MGIELITYVLIAIGVVTSLAVIIIQLIRSRPEVPRRLGHEEDELLHDVVTAYVRYLRRKYSGGSEHEEFEE